MYAHGIRAKGSSKNNKSDYFDQFKFNILLHFERINIPCYFLQLCDPWDIISSNMPWDINEK